MPDEENVCSVKAIPAVRVQEMESQQGKKHLQAPAKTTPLDNQKITSKGVTACTSAVHLIHAQSAQFGGRNTNYRDRVTCAG